MLSKLPILLADATAQLVHSQEALGRAAESLAEATVIMARNAAPGVSFSFYLDLAVKLGNLFAIIWIFRRNFSEKREERLRDVGRDPIKFMVQEVVLKPNMAELAAVGPKLKAHVQALAGKLSSIKDHEEKSSVMAAEIQAFKADVESVRTSIFFPLSYISPDFKPMLEQVAKAEETFTSYAQELFLGHAKDCNDTLENLEAWKASLFSMLHECQAKCWRGLEPAPTTKSFCDRIPKCLKFGLGKRAN